MPSASSVAAIVVTYNRKALLLSCLAGVLEQTFSVNRVFLVDNDSKDGTFELIRSSGHLSDRRIRYIRLPENKGGAGGFREGLRQAVAEGFDWYWLLDDDVEPERNALEAQLRYSDISECIHPQVVYEDGSVHKWEHIFDPYTTQQIGLENTSFNNGKEWCPMNVACFEGMLVSAAILNKVGLPDEEFFVSGDDGLFGFKAALHTNVIYVKVASLRKKIKPSSKMSAFKIYYDLRNRFLLRRKLSRIIPLPTQTRYMFLSFMLILTYNYVRYSFSGDNLKAALYGWLDGIRNVTGRCRY
jgi:GT2 family glycosyltransferase